jgi:hypothetical protein
MFDGVNKFSLIFVLKLDIETARQWLNQTNQFLRKISTSKTKSFFSV